MLNPGVFLCCDRVLHDFYNPAAAENSGFSVRFGQRKLLRSVAQTKAQWCKCRVSRVGSRPAAPGHLGAERRARGPAVPGQEAHRAALLLVWDGGLSPASKRSRLYGIKKPFIVNIVNVMNTL